MKKIIICLGSLLVVLVAAYLIFANVAYSKAEKACDLIFETKGIYNKSCAKLMDKNTYKDLSAEIIYYKHKEIKRGDDFKVLKYEVQATSSPLDFVFDGKVEVICRYSIEYKGKTYESVYSYFETEPITVKTKFDGGNFKVFYEFPPI